MAVLPIITAPDKRLKVKSEPVENVDAELAALMDDMLETMYLAPGVGLAAPQVGVTKRIIVIDVGKTEEEREPLLMANPEVIWESEDWSVYEEGCLSLPEYYADVERPEQVRVKYIDQTNTERELEAEGLLATCIQHEIDHLEGVLFVDHLTSIKRSMILRKLQKAKKMKAAAE
jgi:peptide deformylase